MWSFPLFVGQCFGPDFLLKHKASVLLLADCKLVGSLDEHSSYVP